MKYKTYGTLTFHGYRDPENHASDVDLCQAIQSVVASVGYYNTS
jgi:hypothetical protein